MFYRLIIALYCLIAPTIAYASGQVSGYHLDNQAGKLRLIIDTSSRTSYKIFQLQNPERLVIDLSDVRRGANFPVAKSLNTPPVSQIRSGIQNGVNLRVVLDLTAPITLEHTLASAPSHASGPYTLSVEFSTKTPTHITTLTQKLPPTLPNLTPQPTVKPAPIAETPKVSETKAQEKTNTKPLIILDPGHGGADPGTQGYARTYEKHLTLSYGLALKEAFEKTGRYRVILTRSRDEYVDLKERVRKAKRADGDIFLSLHADSHHDKSLRGLSIYTLSEKASDKEAAELADKENKSDLLYDVNLGTTNPEITGVLIDIIQRENANASSLLAESLIKELSGEIRLLRYPHRFAGFRVLTAPDIPSLLIELGYLSNPEEEGLLNAPTYKKKVVNAIVRSIDNYFKVRTNIY